jgi:signal transduction histidine kinase
LRNEFLAHSPYQLEATFDGGDAIELRVAERRSRERWPGPGQLSCGPVRVRLYAFDLDTTSLARIGPHTEVRAWLREWSGVSVYRDGFRVWPYGEPNNDWLGLDQRRVNNPVVRLSNNQVIGFVAITRDGNPQLLDQTNREGLIHNPAFDDLRRLIDFLFLQIENYRQSIRHPADGQASPGADGEAGPLATLERVASALPADEASRLRKLAGEIKDHINTIQEEHRRTVASYAELAASGQVLLGIESEFRAALEAIRDAAAKFAQESRAEKGRLARPVSRNVAAIQETVELLEKRLADLHSVGRGGGRRRAVDLAAEVPAAVRLIEERARQHSIAVKVVLPEGGKLARAEIRPENVRRILLLLFDNSVHALAGQQERKVQTNVKVTDDRTGFDFWDNGPGIPKDRAEDVFLPHYTTRPGASGMGLTIVREICRSHGGDARVLIRPQAKGVSIRVEFRRKQARATVLR